MLNVLAVILSYAGGGRIYLQIVQVVSPSAHILVSKAPHGYCAFSLPFTGYFEGLLEHTSSGFCSCPRF